LFINLFVCVAASAQDSSDAFRRQKGVDEHSRLLQKIQTTITTAQIFQPQVTGMKVLSADYYKNSIGYFCRKEIQIEKATKLPLKLRLGSVTYTDKMEAKNQGYNLWPKK
jgi:hypothetical protein